MMEFEKLKSHQRYSVPSHNIYKWLTSALFVLIVINVGLHVQQPSLTAHDAGNHLVRVALTISSLVLLLALVIIRQIECKMLNGLAADKERQLDAMLSVLATVKHDLNNDMQVVIGNAELAAIVIANEGDVRQPIVKISKAASMAVERIDQLSVFCVSEPSELTAIDLNATFLECAAKLNTELPSMVTLRLDLEHLPIRVMADKHLLALGLSYLINQAVKTMDDGGEIVIRSQNWTHKGLHANNVVANADVCIVRSSSWKKISAELSQNEKSVKNNQSLKFTSNTAMALLGKSGAVDVRRSMAAHESSVSMGFATGLCKPVPIVETGLAETYV